MVALIGCLNAGNALQESEVLAPDIGIGTTAPWLVVSAQRIEFIGSANATAEAALVVVRTTPGIKRYMVEILSLGRCQCVEASGVCGQVAVRSDVCFEGVMQRAHVPVDLL